jgi:hypothetical protein
MTNVSDLPTLVDHTEVTEIFSSNFVKEAGSRFLVLEQAAKKLRANKTVVARENKRVINVPLQHLI